jgi:hypothetical protein
MKRWLPHLGWVVVGALAMALLLGPTVRRERAWAYSTEVAVNGTQAFVQVPTSRVGAVDTPAAIVRSILMSVMTPFWAHPFSHRANHRTIIVIDARGIRTMVFPGVAGSLLVTPEGPVVRIGDQGLRWTGDFLATLTPDEWLAVQRDAAGPIRPPWSKLGIVFRNPANTHLFTIGGARYALEARHAGDAKTLTLVDPRGARQVVWSLDESWQSPTADQFSQHFQ